MLLNTNLRLLDGKLGELQATPYFEKDLQGFVDQLREVAQVTLDRLVDQEPEVADTLARSIWKATQFLSGSNTNLIPYEVVHCLKVALRDWTDGGYLITTDITADRNFYFHGVPDHFWTWAKTYADVEFKHKLVQIQMPELYRHRPLFNLVLYHELGHFIDTTRNISKLALLYLESDGHVLPSLSSCPSNWSDIEFEAAKVFHAREYFADVFAACYLGDSIREFLGQFVPNDPTEVTHPATYDRLQVISALLNSQDNNLIKMINLALSGLGLPELALRYTAPDLESTFGNVRPYDVRNVEELHGMFEAGWHFLGEASLQKSPPWNAVRIGEVERIINDLMEKSIRNFMIQERWQRAATD
ncbi:hypothetical protein MnTg04_01537 [bacterium MnTg04]|nr:hypothetical protein MnTg04_01537 [bacterium MnTg04]